MIELKSKFKDHIIEFIRFKKSLGFFYDNSLKLLSYFDNFCLCHYPEQCIITNELISAYLTTLSGKHPRTIRTRISIVNEFSKYLSNIGIQSALLNTKFLSKIVKFRPYIFSSKELTDFFAAADNLDYSPKNSLRHITYPLFFRLLYSSGLRLNEATSLQIKDIDFDNCLVKILNAKLDKHRLVPINPKLMDKFLLYFNKYHKFSSEDSYFFIGHTDNKISRQSIERNFHEIRWKANIPYINRDHKSNNISGPRVHDLRHTFAVNCLKRWVQQGKNLNTYLPILQAYLGHSSLRDTAYYLHLTTELFPDIMSKLNYSINNIIPILPTSCNYE
jgi:integrase